jgi:predicted flap endonuclease-1-like 5' DNA nuclease
MELGEINMRSDYALYTVAIIFFIITTVTFALEMTEFERSVSVVTTVVLGLLFIGLGRSQRPRPEATTIAAPPAPTPPTTVTEKTETVMEAAQPVAALIDVKGIGEKRAEQLKALGINSIEDLAKASAKDLAAKLEISPKITRRWVRNAKKLVEES